MLPNDYRMNKLDKETLDEIEKAQEERREYVKNIGIEYRFGCYEEKRADSCHLLGEYAEAIEKNFKMALNLFRDNCDNQQYGKSCYKYAMYLLHGKEVEPSFKKMIRPLEIACDDKMAPACRYLGLVHWNGESDRDPEPKLAAKALERACNMEDGESCWMLSTWYLGPDVKFAKQSNNSNKKKMGTLERDIEKALDFGTRACELNFPQSCANIARMYRIGDGVPKNPDKAKEYIDKANEILEVMRSKQANAGFTGA